MFIPVILGTTRRGRQTPKVARFVHERLTPRPSVETALIDLADLDLPIKEERLWETADPPRGAKILGAALDRADGILFVTPEYNNGYPGVLKNAIDYFLPEFERKPVGIVTVSAGGFGGMQALSKLRLVMLKMRAVPIPAALPVSRVREAFDDTGQPTDERFLERTDRFLDELIWFTEALRNYGLASEQGTA